MNPSRESIKSQFPILLCFIALILTVFAFAWLTYNAIESYTTSEQLKKELIETENILHDVIYYDEALTLSAIMAFSSDETKWKDRYEKYAKLYEPDYHFVLSLADANTSAEIKIATEILLEIENKGFALLEEGKKSEATALLYSEKYLKYKSDYTKTIERLSSEIRSTINKRMEDSKNKALISITASTIVLIISIIIWIVVIDKLKKWRNIVINVSEEEQKEAWIKTGLGELDEIVRHNHNFSEVLYSNIISSVGGYLSATYAGLYKLRNYKQEECFLELVSGYAIDRTFAKKLYLGEGLVGQCGKEQKIKIYQGIGADGIKIESGVATVAPSYIIAIPIVFEGNLKGVVELGLFRPLSELEKEFVSKASHIIASTIDLVARKKETEKHLEESKQLNNRLKSQEEILTAKQEELSVSNKNLKEKAFLLEEQNISIKQKNQELENARRDIKKKAEELEEANKYKSQFMANMSHELRTPLNSVIVLSNLLMNDQKGKYTSEKVKEFAKVINNSGEDLLKLINEILDLAKIEAGTKEVEICNILFKEFKTIFEEQFETVAKEKAIKFSVDIQEGLDFFESDKAKLVQILKNLLSNAFKFTMKEGRVSLNISEAIFPGNKAFKGEMSKTNRYLCFQVKDTGIGIAAENQAVIFEAFKQVDGAIDRRFGGAGLGLTIARNLASLLNGQIVLESQQNQGSVFSLYIPYISPGLSYKVLTIQEPARKEKDLVKETIKGIEDEMNSLGNVTITSNDIKKVLKGKKIFLADDDIRNVFALTSALDSFGVNIVVAHDGKEALEKLSKNLDVQLILMDIMMPEIDGIQVISEIRKNDALKHKPVIAITAKAMNGDREKCLNAGASAYISKPIKVEELAEVMCHHLLKNKQIYS